MTYGEAWRLTTVLARDPSSEVCAAIAEWAYSIDRAALAVLDLYDLQHRSKAKRKPPLAARPWDKERPKKVGGNTVLSIDAMRAVLDKHRAEVTEGG